MSRSSLLKTVPLQLLRVVIFADIIKIVTMFIKTISKDSKKLKHLEIMYQNVIYVCIIYVLI